MNSMRREEQSFPRKISKMETMHKRNKEYEICGAECYILEFKFKEKCWAIDATKEDGSLGRLINVKM